MQRPIQEKAAQQLADIGADYIVGSHPHVLQKVDIIKSKDGRKVPVAYSLGNLVSSMNDVKNNVETMLLRLSITKDKNGVRIVKNQYIPCTILSKYKKTRFCPAPVLPTFCGYEGSNTGDMFNRLSNIRVIVGEKIESVEASDCIFEKVAVIAPEARLFMASCRSGGHTIRIEWDEIAGADGYRVYGRNEAGAFIGIRNADNTFIDVKNDSGLAAAYKIKAFKLIDGKSVFFRTSINVYPEIGIPNAASINNKKPLEHPHISFIIPVYNGELYISRAIDSVLQNSTFNYEIVVVNDGSTDNTPAILDKYKEIYPGVVIPIHQKNGGISAARNTGLNYAKGSYIGFIDDDDRIRNNACERYEKAIGNSPDIVISCYCKYGKNGDQVIQGTLPFQEGIVYDINEFLDLLYGKGYAGHAPVWNKLYRRELIVNRGMPSMKGEDVAWSPYIASYADTFCYVNTPLYEYIRRQGSTSDIINQYSPEEVFQRRMRSINYFLENGNPERREQLIGVAKKRLLWHHKNSPGNNLYMEALNRLK
jgi:glycosyltransferase involved in cell wall biosynthesis